LSNFESIVVGCRGRADRKDRIQVTKWFHLAMSKGAILLRVGQKCLIRPIQQISWTQLHQDCPATGELFKRGTVPELNRTLGVFVFFRSLRILRKWFPYKRIGTDDKVDRCKCFLFQQMMAEISDFQSSWEIRRLFCEFQCLL